MRAPLLALLLVLAGSTGASAYCPSLPDDGSTSYTQNQTALALCRTREIADRVALEQQRVEIQGEINYLNQQVRLNEQFARARAALPQF